ncbi:MAG TPA: hypothetical protein EYP59_17925, partial [Thiotrichaceae bacterium]|nr:hypothetical protein [Thiotrichaceae bacterium]
MEWIKQNIEWLFSGVGITFSAVVSWLISHAWRNRSNILGSIVNRNTFYVDFNDVPWTKLLNKSSQIDIVVHYFNSWIKTNNHDLLEFKISKTQNWHEQWLFNF